MPAGPQSGYRLQANSRVVLTDVTVTDTHGNPVHGLKVSDFRIFDNDKPQQIATFEEHREDDTAPRSQAATAAGIYSNDYLAHPPRVLNIIFLDLTNISIEDQMYLNYQLGKFFDALSPDEPVAIYARTGGASILLQSFTSDRALLRSAVQRLIPRFPPRGREYLNDFQTLQQIELYVGQIPGRKNVLWLSGGSTFFLNPDVRLMAAEPQWRTVYDELETERIALYPIDVRGLTVVGGSVMVAQHALMSRVAEATGGHAFFDNNGIAQGIAKTIKDDGEYYTFTYSPRDFRYDNKWHKVRVTLPETGYTLSYRRGYFADATQPIQRPPSGPRTRLLAHGKTANELPTARMPIVFQASVHYGTAPRSDGVGRIQAGKPRRGAKPFTVEYSLPLDAFAIESVGGKPTVECGTAVIAFNDDGTVIAHQGQEVTLTLKADAAAHPAGKVLPISLEVDLPKGNSYLYVAAWDITSKRLGTLEIPYRVPTTRDLQQTSLPK